MVQVSGGTGDQIYASVVSTLLSLMDGVVNRGAVVVIGATNRCAICKLTNTALWLAWHGYVNAVLQAYLARP